MDLRQIMIMIRMGRTSCSSFFLINCLNLSTKWIQFYNIQVDPTAKIRKEKDERKQIYNTVPVSRYLLVLTKGALSLFQTKGCLAHTGKLFLFIFGFFHLFIQYYLMIFSKYEAPYSFFQLIQAKSPRMFTPEISPVIDGLMSYIKTPMVRKGKQIGSTLFQTQDLEDFNDFILEGECQAKNDQKSKKIKKSMNRPRLHSTWHVPDCQLDNIIEEVNKNEQSDLNSSISQQFSEEEKEFILEREDSNFIEEGKSLELEKQSTTNFDLLLNQQPIYLEWYHPNPKKELVSKIKTVCSNEQFKTDEEKIENLKSTISSYIFDHEKFHFEESMNQLSGNINNILATLLKGIDQTFRRTIGNLSFEKRRLKLVKYMEKKKRRVWRKKVNYDCRKKVADGRLRIKGKFVTYEQARQQLGMSSLEGYNADEIRNMIESRIDS